MNLDSNQVYLAGHQLQKCWIF